MDGRLSLVVSIEFISVHQANPSGPHLFRAATTGQDSKLSELHLSTCSKALRKARQLGMGQRGVRRKASGDQQLSQNGHEYIAGDSSPQAAPPGIHAAGDLTSCPDEQPSFKDDR
jgi:hypothetical protein